MEYDTFLQSYDTLSVAYYDTYKGYQVVRNKLNGKELKYEINNPVAQHLYIQVDMYAPRHYPRVRKCKKLVP